jgi:nucleoside-diphosphate-sugar epimerase
MPTAFVTGGSGFIGGRLIQRLRTEGWAVRALARSDGAVDGVTAIGAEAVPGDLEDAAALRTGSEGADVVFHCAAKADDWGAPGEFERVNIRGTENVLAAARDAGARRVVHVGTEAALMAGQPLVDIDEDTPLRPDSAALYPATKAKAERAVRAANRMTPAAAHRNGQGGRGGPSRRRGLETVVIRPRFVWGRGDTTLVPVLVQLVDSGRFRWIGGGTHLTAITHVDNAVEGLWLGATKAPAGGVYFVTDGDPVVFKEFVDAMIATQGVRTPDKTIPLSVAKAAAAASEGAWRALKRPGHPPLTRFAVWASGMECTIDISRARRDLGYEPVKDQATGLAEMRQAKAA